MHKFNHPSAPDTSREQKNEQSNQTSTPGLISWKKALAIVAVPLLLLFGAAFQSSNSVPGQLQAIQSQLSALQAQVKGPRKFYLTQTSEYDGAEALSACAPGYHMASMWEISDPSNLRYDRDRGHTEEDSGFGPPNRLGWIRTGESSSDTALPAGRANCNSWTSADAVNDGTSATPVTAWGNGPSQVSPWDSRTLSCSAPNRVWCVQD